MDVCVFSPRFQVGENIDGQSNVAANCQLLEVGGKVDGQANVSFSGEATATRGVRSGSKFHKVQSRAAQRANALASAAAQRANALATAAAQRANALENTAAKRAKVSEDEEASDDDVDEEDAEKEALNGRESTGHKNAVVRRFAVLGAEITVNLDSIFLSNERALYAPPSLRPRWRLVA